MIKLTNAELYITVLIFFISLNLVLSIYFRRTHQLIRENHETCLHIDSEELLND